MVIIYESKTGFTKRYADMLAAKMRLTAFRVQEISNINHDEEIIFLGWMKAGKIQGVNKMHKHNMIAVCGSGTGRSAEPSAEAVITRNKITGIPFFYLRGGCFPLKELTGMNKIMMSMFVKILKGRKDKDENIKESISHIENGFDGVHEDNLEPLLAWLKAR